MSAYFYHDGPKYSFFRAPEYEYGSKMYLAKSAHRKVQNLAPSHTAVSEQIEDTPRRISDEA